MQGPQATRGSFEKLPDFLLRDHEWFRQTMRDRGYELSVVKNPPDLRGTMFTASYRHKGASFRSTQPEERQAVCVAGLKVYGLQVSNDQ